MKKVSIVLAIAMALFLSAGSASAAYMQITPSLPTEIPGLYPIEFDLEIVNNDQIDFDVHMLSYNLIPDSFEITLEIASTWTDPILDTWNGFFQNNKLGYGGVTEENTITVTAGQSYLLATFTFLPIHPIRDALSDLAFDGSEQINFVSVSSSSIDGGDVVPIPGAVWLLGSGLMGLVCLRRRARK